MSMQNMKGEIIFKVHYKYDDITRLGFIEKYTMPTGITVRFKGKKIDLKPLKEHVGELFIFVRNGVEEGPYELQDVAPNKRGVMAMHYDTETKDSNE